MGRKANILINDIKEDFSEQWYGREDFDMWPLWIDDIVSGVARLNWYGDRDNQRPLSTVSIIKCFLCLDEISTANIMELLVLKKSQAKLYMKACSLCYPFFVRALNDNSIKKMKYNRQSIATTDQGYLMRYEYTNRALI